MSFKRCSELAGSLAGKAVIVLGNSPALNEVNKSLLDDFITIGVNRILRTYTPHFLLFCDSLIAEKDYFSQYEGTLLLHDKLQRLEDSGITRTDNVYLFSLSNSYSDNSILPKGDIIFACGNTPGYSVQVATLFGASVIGILGVDFNAHILNKAGKPSHFYGFGRDFKSTGAGPFQGRSKDFYIWFKKACDKEGVQCYNLSPFEGSPFEASEIPKISLEEFHARFKDIGS